MPPLQLHLLGGFRIIGAGVEVALPTRKAEALLAYLALPPGRAHRREALAALLWGERGDEQARHSLSQTLFSLRKALAAAGAAPALVADGRTVALDPAAVEVDVVRFERLLAVGTPAALAEAAALYRGELLAGFGLREEAFEEWLVAERSRLREMALAALAQLLEAHGRAGETERALQAALRLVALDPLQEAAHRALMRLYAEQGRPAAALKQYELCARTLKRDLGVQPEADTRQLYEEISRRRSARDQPAAGSAAPAGLLVADRGAGLEAAAFARTPTVAERERAEPALPFALAAPCAPAPVGREAELGRLHGWLDTALAGARQVVFVTGEAGLGKTTLVDAFVAAAARREALWTGHGQCLEQRGAGEPYMPVLEALGRLCQAPPWGPELIALLARRAPTWLVQMPWLVAAPDLEALQRRVLGATRERMLREMVEAVEALTARRPLLLVLEDLHWSDHSTIELLARLAQRPEPARLLVIGTYRPAEVAAGGHPLAAAAQELRAHGLCQELPLAFLSEAATAAYLAARFPGFAAPAGLARLLHERTDGNPLFMGNVVESWIDQGLLVETDGRWALWAGLEELATGVPATLRQLIERQLERLDAEQQGLLEAASVAGRRFSAATVAAGVGRDEDEVERGCAALARRGQFLQARGTAEWPDGTVAARFGFLHDLYQEVLYERVPPGRRVRLHQRIGARIEAGYGARAPERAAELAVHFRRGRNHARAVQYSELAAEQALRRSAHHEAIAHLTAALDALHALPDDGARARRELALQLALAPQLIATQGWAAPEAERAYLLAHELCRQLGDPPQLSQVLYGLATLYEYRGDYRRSQALLTQRLGLPDQPPDPVAFQESHELLACSLFHQGAFTKAVEHAELGLTGYSLQPHHRPAADAGDLATKNRTWAALALWFLGYPDRALAKAREALAQGREAAHAYGLATAQFRTALLHQLRGEAGAAREQVEASLALATERGFPHRVATGMILRGWALVATQDRDEEGVALMREGLAACRQTGTELDRPYYLALLADAYCRRGRAAEGLAALDEALAMVHSSRSFFYEAELHRLKGSLLLQARAQGDTADGVEASFRQALTVARRQQAKSLELRTTLSLARLRSRRGERAEARSLLAPICGWFTEGFDAPDLQDAQALLAELG